MTNKREIEPIMITTAKGIRNCTCSNFFHIISPASYRYGHMIDNVVLIVTGTLHERDVHELLEKCHPLGMFDR